LSKESTEDTEKSIQKKVIASEARQSSRTLAQVLVGCDVSHHPESFVDLSTPRGIGTPHDMKRQQEKRNE
jgi:hypothetical protein